MRLGSAAARDLGRAAEPGRDLGARDVVDRRDLEVAAHAALAGQAAAVAWDALLPLYHQEPAPVLQRAAARETSVA